MKNLLDFCDAVLENGGATFNLVLGTSPTTGYAVSKQGHEDTIDLFGNKVTQNMLVNSFVRKYVSEHGFELSLVDYNLGGWIHDKKLYLDISILFDNEADASEYARDNNQLAYFDLTNGKEIFV
jgi:hypothetical protein